MIKCKKCEKIHNGEYGSGLFCSEFCARSFSMMNDDKNELKKAICIECNKQILINKRADSKKAKCIECREFKPILINVCHECGDNFETTNKSTKYCSDICRNYVLSVNRSKFLLKNGTSNFKTKREIFTYKNVENIECDSKLEQAAIIYLIDIFKAERIERFKSILNFWNNDSHRTFNPDFYVKKDNDIYIVEVKMTWEKDIDHIYNNFIPLKKEALKLFCDNKGYTMIWLDFDYDRKFKPIYRKWLYNNRKKTNKI